MTAFLSWVDYSAAERQRMRQAVALFSHKQARDELGLGSIRDAISDVLFPGTSVIQTRLRYALFIPWIYSKLEIDKRTHAANVADRARAAEIALIEPLASSSDTNGVCSGSLLAEAVDSESHSRPHLDVQYPWDAFHGSLSSKLTLARRFSLLMYGAARLYNVVLARRRETFKTKAEEHAKEFAAWCDEAREDDVALGR